MWQAIVVSSIPIKTLDSIVAFPDVTTCPATSPTTSVRQNKKGQGVHLQHLHAVCTCMSPFVVRGGRGLNSRTLRGVHHGGAAGRAPPTWPRPRLDALPPRLPASPLGCCSCAGCRDANWLGSPPSAWAPAPFCLRRNVPTSISSFIFRVSACRSESGTGYRALASSTKYFTVCHAGRVGSTR